MVSLLYRATINKLLQSSVNICTQLHIQEIVVHFTTDTTFFAQLVQKLSKFLWPIMYLRRLTIFCKHNERSERNQTAISAKNVIRQFPHCVSKKRPTHGLL